MVKIKIKNINLISAGKITGVISAIIGIIFSLLMFFLGSLLKLGGVPFFSSSSIFIIIIFPIIYGIIGFISGCLGAGLYNFASETILKNGIELNIDEIENN